MKPRPLAPAEQEAFRLARLGAVERTPYFARALFAVKPLAVDGLGTFAVDQWWRLYMDPARLAGPEAWTPQERSAVLIHEVGHLIRDHAGRRSGLAQPVDHDAWNLAADAEINDDLLAAGVPLPSGGVTPAGLGQPDNDLAETYYAAICRPDVAHDLSEPAHPEGCGSGAGAVPGRYELGSVDPDAKRDLPAGLTAADGEAVRRVVARDVQDAAATGRGSVPAGIERWAAETLRPATVPWRRVLRAAVRRAVSTAAGRVDYSYRRPSRRRVPGVILPSMRGPQVRVAVVVDTSGSMSAADLAAALSELRAVLSAPSVDRSALTVLTCDAGSSTPRRVRRLADVQLIGGGGTDMRVGIDAAMSARAKPHVVVVLTDGDTPWPGQPVPDAALICAVISSHPPVGTPSWASTVHVPVGR